MALPQDRHAAGRRTDGSLSQLADVAAEMAAAMDYLETLGVRLRASDQAGEWEVAAIPPNTLVALRRSCQRVAQHSDRALTAMNPQRAAAARAAAAQLREVETIRFSGRSR